jgi:hypothetical protein
MLDSRPTMTQLPVPMLPGMSTGCPMSRYCAGSTSEPGGKERVAPFLWT